MKITQSVLGAADKCMLAAQYTLDPPLWFKRVGSSSRATGTGYHAGLEHLYGFRKAWGCDTDLGDITSVAVETFDKSITMDLYDNTPIEEFKWDEKVPDRETAVELIAVMLAEYVNGGHVWPMDWEILGIEVNATFDDPECGPNIQTKLGADLVLRDPNGWIVAVDHKTANKAWDANKATPRKNNQSCSYLRNLRRQYPDAPGYRFVFDIMQYPNTKSGPRFERRISDPEPRHEAAIVKKTHDFAAMYTLVHINQGLDLPANPASTLCNPKWCDFFQGCPFGAALDN